MQTLTAAFADQHPADTAEIIGAASVAEISEFVADLAPGTTAAVLAGLDGLKLRGFFTTAEPAVVSEILLHANQNDFLNLAAQLDNTSYPVLIEAAGERNEELQKRLQAFSNNSIGALATTLFYEVQQGKSVADAAMQLGDAGDTRDLPIFLLSPERKVIGVLPAITFISQKHQARMVDEFAEKVIPLKGNTSVQEALEARQWRTSATLPVVSRDNKLIGAIDRATLLAVTANKTTKTYRADEMMGELARGYIEVCARLLDLAFRGKQP